MIPTEYLHLSKKKLYDNFEALEIGDFRFLWEKMYFFFNLSASALNKLYPRKQRTLFVDTSKNEIALVSSQMPEGSHMHVLPTDAEFFFQWCFDLPEVNVSNDRPMSASLERWRHRRTNAAIRMMLQTIPHNNDMMQNACVERTKSETDIKSVI